MSAPAYDAYRDSGIDWLGKVPSHWSASPLKAAYSIFGGATPKSEREDYWDGGVPWVTPADLSRLTSPFIGETLRTISETGLASCAATLVPADSVILSTRAPIGSIGITTASATTNQGCKALVPRGGAVPSFLAYSLSIATEQLRVRGKGTTFLELSGDELGRFKVPTPPPAEQAAIAAFLDRETGKIDALVKAQTRLIELLKEKRQAVISHAVTKGLDPAAPMKDSGVEWLGEVPAHWEVIAVWMLFTLGRGRVLSHQDIAENAGPYPVYSSQTENDGEMGCISTFDFEGDYLTWTTDGAHAGTVFRRSGRFNCTNVCGTLKPKADINLDFFQAALAEATGFYVRHDINPKLMNNVMGGIRMPLPPREDQTAVAAHVREQTKGFALLAHEAEAAITLLQERRAALISAAVTGKIDVRGLAPEQAEAA